MSGWRTLTKMKTKLHILTTATPRRDLHYVGLFPAVDALREREEFEVIWYVNLDCPVLFSEDDFNKSLQAFKDMGATVFTNTEDPCFAQAARVLYTNCQDNLNPAYNNVFMWLEDDWTMHYLRLEGFAATVAGWINTRHSCLLTVIPHRIGGQPCFFRLPLFEKVAEQYRLTDAMIDPEVTIMEEQRKLDGVSDSFYTPPVGGVGFEDQLFIDIGRNWRKYSKIGKTSRFDTKEHTWYPDEHGTTEW